MLLKNIATVKQSGEQLIFSDILGSPSMYEGTIEQIDLLENFSIVKPSK